MAGRSSLDLTVWKNSSSLCLRFIVNGSESFFLYRLKQRTISERTYPQIFYSFGISSYLSTLKHLFFFFFPLLLHFNICRQQYLFLLFLIRQFLGKAKDACFRKIELLEYIFKTWADICCLPNMWKNCRIWTVIFLLLKMQHEDQ